MKVQTIVGLLVRFLMELNNKQGIKIYFTGCFKKIIRFYR